MSSCKISLSIDRLRSRIARLREVLPGMVAMEMRRVAEVAIERRYDGDARGAGQGRDRGMVHGRIRKLDAVFVPVVLKHVRREQWPELLPIYEARVLRRQATYMGRKRFWVDEVKLDALRRQQLARRMSRLSEGDWRVSVRPGFGTVRVRVWKKGGISKRDRATVRGIVEEMKGMFAERATAVLYEAMR